MTPQFPTVDDQSSKKAGALTFAHISDPHLTTLTGVPLKALIGKRLLGYLSWRSRRRQEHLPEVLRALQVDLSKTKPNHTVVTGDLTQIGLPSEFLQARHWLERLGAPSDITLVPGNHDRYRQEYLADTFIHWAPYMASDPGCQVVIRKGAEELEFPTLRVRGPVAFIGLNSGRPSATFLAVGSVGPAQLETLDSLLAETAERGLFRVILIHHPPTPGTVKWRKRLTDGAALRRIIQTRGVELVLHGHAHRVTRSWVRTPEGRALVLGAPSASAVGHRPERRSLYYVLSVRSASSAWQVSLDTRRYDLTTGEFVAGERENLTLPVAAVARSSVRSNSAPCFGVGTGQ